MENQSRYSYKVGDVQNMYKLYIIENSINDMKYVGITTQPGTSRLYGTSNSTHEGRANSGDPLPLYEDIRKYGIDKFKMIDLSDHVYDRKLALIKESETMVKLLSEGCTLYNKDIYQAESAVRTMNEKYKSMTDSERSDYSRLNINSPEAIAKRGETRKGVPQYNIRGKNHGKSRRVKVTSHDNLEFDSITECVNHMKSYYPTLNTQAVSKICNGYTPKRYSGLVIEYIDCR